MLQRYYVVHVHVPYMQQRVAGKPHPKKKKKKERKKEKKAATAAFWAARSWASKVLELEEASAVT